METTYSIDDWKTFLEKENVPPQEREAILYQVEVAFSQKVPVILDIEHLSRLMGIKQALVASMVHSSETFYRRFQIPKRKGGTRTIVSAYPSLLHCQQWIAKYVLSSFEIHEAAFAYRKGRNILHNAQMHMGERYVLQLDLEDFFGHITPGRVRKLFEIKGYNKLVSFFLTGLCCLDNSIPQGASTSPILSNIIMLPMDNRLSKLGEKMGFTYTRYADDLVFSSEREVLQYESTILKIIEESGFKVNWKKRRSRSPQQRKIITGLHVTKDDIRLPKHKRRKIRQEVYFIKKNDLAKTLEETGDLFVLDRLLGHLNFWKMVEPENSYPKEQLIQLHQMAKEWSNNQQ